jgi:hypothetical protein
MDLCRGFGNTIAAVYRKKLFRPTGEIYRKHRFLERSLRRYGNLVFLGCRKPLSARPREVVPIPHSLYRIDKLGRYASAG